MSTFPGAIYSPRTKENKEGVVYDPLETTTLFADDFTNNDAEIVAIETELGTTPSGVYDTVKAWLTALTSAVVVKCTGAEINTGTDDDKFATPKAIADSDIAFLSDIPSVPVKATGAEIDTGTDDDKFATPKAIEDSNLARTTDIPVKATGAEINTGTDDAKFATSKAIRDSGVLSGSVSGEIAGLDAKATPVDADVALIEDSAASNAKKKLTWANIKATLKAYFDTLYLALAGGTLTGNITFGENTSLILDPALSADGKYCGVTEAGTAGATLVFGDVCYFNNNDSRWELVDANVADGYDKKIGICVLAAASDGDPTTMLLYGKIRADAVFPALTIGAPVYMGETAGDVVVAQPSTADVCIRILGFGNTADELFFNPSNDYIVHV